MTRLAHHGWLFAGSAVALGIGALAAPYTTAFERLSVVSAWLCMGMLAAALLIGPMRRARGELPPANIYLRRDIAIWATINGFLHFWAGTVVSMDPIYIAEFVRNPELAMPGLEMRDRLFTWGSLAGTAVAIIFLLLLAISSDRALRLLGVKVWKRVQWTAHIALWATVFHGFAYQVLESRWVPFAMLLLLAIFIVVIQRRGRRASVSG